MTNVLQEFVTANSRLNPKHFENLTNLGVPNSVWHGGISLVGVAFVDTADVNRYWPLERGNPHYVCPIGEGGTVGEWWSIDDLVAFKPSEPDKWRLRLGVGTLLGLDWPEWCRLHEEPLRLFSNPLEWLRGSGRGSCIVDWSINLPLHLGNVSSVICDSVELASRVTAAFTEVGPTPEIRLPKEALSVAA